MNWCPFWIRKKWAFKEFLWTVKPMKPPTSDRLVAVHCLLWTDILHIVCRRTFESPSFFSASWIIQHNLVQFVSSIANALKNYSTPNTLYYIGFQKPKAFRKFFGDKTMELYSQTEINKRGLIRTTTTELQCRACNRHLNTSEVKKKITELINSFHLIGPLQDLVTWPTHH